MPGGRVADRTFNARPARARALLRLFRDEAAPLRFHLELDPALVTPALAAELAAAGPGRFHLEVGIQSLDPAVLRAVGRRGTPRRALAGLRRLLGHPALAVHADLLAGLPGGTLAGVLDDLRMVAGLGPGAIQLELLKLLPGTRLAAEAAARGIVAAPDPPYEVLRTPTMSPDDLETARVLSAAVDWVYNAPALRAVAGAASRALPEFWGALARAAAPLARLAAAPALERRFRLLDDLLAAAGQDSLRQALRYAWLRHGLSAQHGLCAATPWRGPVPPGAELVEGDRDAPRARAFRAELEAPYLFVYGAGRSVAAIYRLPF